MRDGGFNIWTLVYVFCVFTEGLQHSREERQFSAELEGCIFERAQMHDGRRKGSAEVLHTPGPGPPAQARSYLTAAARAPPACSLGCPSTPAPVFFLCGTCRSLAHTQQSESSKLAPSKILWPETDNETLLCPKALQGWQGEVEWKVRISPLVNGVVMFWTEL